MLLIATSSAIAGSQSVKSTPLTRSSQTKQATAAPATQPKPLTLEANARAILAEMIASNTTESTGATTPLVLKLAARFRAAGFSNADVMVLGGSARHKNLVVRMRGSTRAKPVIINAHLDVVEAPRLDWKSDPFVLTERDGHLYGRGVIDDKGSASAAVATFIELRRQGFVPRRDLVLALTAGEESGNNNGVEWLLANRRTLMDGEFVLNLDAGGADMSEGRPTSYAIQAAEKVYVDLELVARGPGGHSSVPIGTTPIDRLARALDRLSRNSFPVRVNPVLRLYMERRAAQRGGEIGEAMAALAAEPNDLRAQNVLLKDPLFAAQLRTTCIATMLRGGTAPNAIPQEVGATVNCRMLPGESQESVVQALKAAISDTAVEIRVLTPANPSEPSTPTPAFLAMIERVASPDGKSLPAIPYMETGATDGVFFRTAGIPTFGVAGYYLEAGDLERAHGRDERIGVSAFRELVRYTERLFREVAAH